MKISIKQIKEKTTGFVRNAVRVMRLMTKPKKQEFLAVAKVTGLGIVIIGLIGFVIESIRWLLAG